jgi:hypothetical protein
VTNVVADAEDCLLSLKQLVEACDTIVWKEAAVLVSEDSYTFSRLDLLVCHRVKARAGATDVIGSRWNELVLSTGQIKALLRGIELWEGSDSASTCYKAGDGE